MATLRDQTSERELRSVVNLATCRTVQDCQPLLGAMNPMRRGQPLG
ncbi:hypothetical protein I552_6716 [Mycobacterium xenopi 3993]|nr:hypothetical protein I552_6716 [Mycobacterium xenopi 3993]